MYTVLFNEITETKALVEVVTTVPTKEQKENGIEVSRLPVVDDSLGVNPQYYINPQTGDMWVEYAGESKLQKLEKELNTQKITNAQIMLMLARNGVK